jgi:hypothetical protein
MSHWNHRVCTFKEVIDGKSYDKIGVFEVYYDDEKKVIGRAAEPERAWFIENCGDENTPESAAKGAQWELKCMLKAFRNPILDAEKDF